MSHWYDSTPRKSRRKRDSNPGSSALEADALPLGQRGDYDLSPKRTGAFGENHNTSASKAKLEIYHEHVCLICLQNNCCWYCGCLLCWWWWCLLCLLLCKKSSFLTIIFHHTALLEGLCCRAMSRRCSGRRVRR